jgi:DNA replication and repair protein RecF
MILTNMELERFRNYDHAKIEFSPGMNIFFGQNAQGKTNLLEAIAMFSLGKSFRAKKEEEVIQWNEETGFIRGVFSGETNPAVIEIGIGRREKRYKLNGQIVKRNDIFAQVPVVIFAPDDLQLIKGSPSYRRDFIDLYLAQIEPKYRLIYYNYTKILKQRNRLLKEHHIDHHELEVWNEQLVEKGAKVTKYRLFLIESILPYIGKVQRQISNESEELRVEYLGFKDRVLNQMDETAVKILLQEAIISVRQAELDRRVTLVGPQLDDLRITLSTGVELRVFGSQGQQRTAALAMKLGLIEKIKDTRGEYPVLLLDDVMSEFDDSRKQALLTSLINSVQTFVTATGRKDFPGCSPEAVFFEIERGTVKNVQ